jgi:uncharacterized membrane protein YecN with MAPEG domain
MKLEHILDAIHVSVTRRWWMQLFTAFTRCLLGVAFIPPSIPKILHKPFTMLPDTNPVGAYFSALMATGFYYEFLGWSQLIAAVLLLIPRTSHIGAMMFLPIIVNIAVLTSSVGFAGTWVLTIFMSLAALYLVAWEYDRLKPLVFYTRRERPRKMKLQWLIIPAFFTGGASLMATAWWALGLGNFPNYVSIGLLLCGLGLVFGVGVWLHYRSMPVGNLGSGRERA